MNEPKAQAITAQSPGEPHRTEPPQTLAEIVQLLHRARKLLPEPHPLEDREIAELHRRILALETAFENIHRKRERTDRTTSRRA
jgi:hypothetical protein